MIFRIYVSLRGIHFHWRFFVAPGKEHTFASIGTLTMARPESELLMLMLETNDSVEFVEEKQ